MSRCFPFPPPGYVLNGIRIRDEAMIDSIKGVELEKVKKEERSKEKKRDKKDKKERKEKKKEKKRKEREKGDGVSEKHSHKRSRKDEGVKDGHDQKVQEKTNCLDKSSLTVELELLQSSSQNSCDSTLNSNEKEKPKEQPPLVDGRHNNSNDSESIIRIRLPIRRQKDPEVMMLMTNKDPQKPREVKLDTSQRATTTSEQQPVNQHPFSTSAPQHASKLQQPVNQHPCFTSAPEHTSKPHEEKRKDHISTTKLSKEKMSATKHSKEKVSSTKHSKEKISSLSWTPEPYQPSRLCSICPPSLAAQFLNVVENWVPTTTERRVELINSGDEECWWIMNKPSSHNKFDTERCKQLNINNEIQQATAWPCARLLPEADVRALPYTVPF